MGAEAAETEGAEAEVKGKCHSVTTWPLHLPCFFIAGAELKMQYTLYYFTKKNLLSYYKNTTLFIYNSILLLL